MKVKIRTKIFLLFTGLMLISLLNFGLINSMERVSAQDYNWVTHTHIVIQHSENLLGDMRDAETGQRGFLLTGDPKYLEPFFSGSTRSKQELQILLQRTLDNPQQQQRLGRIAELIDSKLEELNQTIALHKTGNTQASIDIVESDLGKQLMDNIRQEIHEFQQEEEALLETRRATYAKMQTAIEHTFLLESLIIVIATIGLLWYVNKSILHPLSLLTESARAYRFNKSFIPVQLATKDEIGELADAFNQMGERVTRSRDELVNENLKTQTKLNNALTDATTDPLTGLKNRRYMHDKAQHLITDCASQQRPLSMILLDVDHFKHINDKFGHANGDEVLRSLGKSINTSIRSSDIGVRYGGEEFVLLLPDTSLENATAIAEGFREQVETMHLNVLDGEQITISLGVAQLQADEKDIHALFIRADKAMYEAKNNGRNQTRIAADATSFPNIEI